MPTLAKAIKIATEAHKGQTDKIGMPYIAHVFRVSEAGKTLDEKIAGALNDILEDTLWTEGELYNVGFSKKVIDAVVCLSKISEDEPYEDFINRVKNNPLAVRVKINDLSDNMDIRRLDKIEEQEVKRLQKYLKAHKELISS